MKKLSKEERKAKRKERRDKKLRQRYSRQPTDHDWLFVYTGTEDDLISYTCVLVLNPGFVFYGILMVTGRIYNPILMYIVLDGLIIMGWTIAALYQKRKLDKWNAMTKEEQHAYYWRLIEQLDDTITPEPEEPQKTQKTRKKEKWCFSKRSFIRNRGFISESPKKGTLFT